MSLRTLALAALGKSDLQEKLALVAALKAEASALAVEPETLLPEAATLPGRPAQPLLIEPAQVPRRSVHTLDGRAALIHAICHIEFNAINLALDAVWRFAGMPEDFYRDWLRVAIEEAHHFNLLHEHLQALAQDERSGVPRWCYGSFAAHDGLWAMCEKTRHDITARMALVPRTLEARGLDATPLIQTRLRQVATPDALAACDILDIILRDEIGHVAIGDRWFREQCAARGLEPEATYLQLIDDFRAPRPQPPLHIEARLAAGFSVAELEALSRPRKR